MRILVFLSAFLLMAADPTDEATKRWWNHVKILAADNMEGRDTGSEGYKRAARYVVEQFEKAGLKPAGESGYSQSVPLRAVRLRKPESSAVLITDQGKVTMLQWYQDLTLTPRATMPEAVAAPLVFAGDDVTGTDLKGKIAVTIAGGRGRNLGAAGTLSIDNPKAIETPRWPVAYATVMSIEGKERAAGAAGIAMRFNPAAAEKLLEGSGHTFAQLLELAAAKKPLPTFELKKSIKLKLKIDVAELKSDNILAVLPGSELPDEYVAISAHLDGYGFGEPVKGDALYNGAFDDSAYVAELIEVANAYHRAKKSPKRSLLFCVFTGEEKGLLGSDYFTSHFTIPKEKIVADINLDYLRPIFPLKILTTLGLEESTLGESVKRVAEPLGIRIQNDNEPERGLFRRSDQYNFIRNGIPGIAFIFGYENGSPEEAIYRKWYAERYHRPSDDLNQPIDFTAAAKFNLFFSSLVDMVANSMERPMWKAGSQYAPK